MKVLNLLFIIGFGSSFFAQSYAPAAGESGSTAIPYNDERFVAWAYNVKIVRGFINIEDTTIQYQGSNRATFGNPEDAIGPATNSTTEHVVSLGDGGVAVVTFEKPITNKPGADFAVFENGLEDDFLELAHVEVSSDGVNYVRFPSHSETQTDIQIGSFGSINPSYLYNLAGKYKVGYGTPFDLEELKDSVNLNIEKITHIKIVDVVGSLGSHGTTDSYGNKINDPFPTPFGVGGFDLNGVGVIHEYEDLGLNSEGFSFTVYPNPSSGMIYVNWGNSTVKELVVFNGIGKVIRRIPILNHYQQIEVELSSGIYFIQAKSKSVTTNKKVFVR